MSENKTVDISKANAALTEIGALLREIGNFKTRCPTAEKEVRAVKDKQHVGLMQDTLRASTSLNDLAPKAENDANAILTALQSLKSGGKMNNFQSAVTIHRVSIADLDRACGRYLNAYNALKGKLDEGTITREVASFRGLVTYTKNYQTASQKFVRDLSSLK